MKEFVGAMLINRIKFARCQRCPISAEFFRECLAKLFNIEINE
jgi:hypothetical protein